MPPLASTKEKNMRRTTGHLCPDTGSQQDVDGSWASPLLPVSVGMRDRDVSVATEAIKAHCGFPACAGGPCCRVSEAGACYSFDFLVDLLVPGLQTSQVWSMWCGTRAARDLVCLELGWEVKALGRAWPAGRATSVLSPCRESRSSP